MEIHLRISGGLTGYLLFFFGDEILVLGSLYYGIISNKPWFFFGSRDLNQSVQQFMSWGLGVLGSPCGSVSWPWFVQRFGSSNRGVHVHGGGCLSCWRYKNSGVFCWTAGEKKLGDLRKTEQKQGKFGKLSQGSNFARGWKFGSKKWLCGTFFLTWWRSKKLGTVKNRCVCVESKNPLWFFWVYSEEFFGWSWRSSTQSQ